MITIEYGDTGIGRYINVNDFNYNEWTTRLKNQIDGIYGDIKADLHYLVSTSIFITAIRLEIAKGNIDYNKIQFKFGNKIFQANEYGCMLDWPKGFCDKETDLCQQILSTNMEKRKSERRSS
jgi:hypothetical protein